MTTSDANKLRTVAIEALRLNDGNIKKAAPKLARKLLENASRPLLIALCANYLSALPKSEDAPAPKPTARKPVKAHSRRREGAHRRTGLPTSKQRAGAIAAKSIVADEIFLRKIRGEGPLGSIQVNRLRAIAESQSMTAVSFLERGYDDAVEAIVCQTLSDYCVTADPFAKVVDVIPAKVAEKAFKDARIQAAEIIRDGSAKIAHDLVESARNPKLIEGDARQ